MESHEKNGTVNCIRCKHCSAGRWTGWSCFKGVPGDDDDYSCWEEDEDKEFWDERRFNDTGAVAEP